MAYGGALSLTTTLFMIAGYYLALKTQSSTLFCKDGDFKQFLIKNVPVVREKYLPSIFCFNGYVHTAVAILFRGITLPIDTVNYERENLMLNDGGEVAIDWRYPKSDGPHSLITVVILPGITGDSQVEYVRETVNELFENGYCSVVFNYRGRGGMRLKTARAYSANNIEDLTEVLKHVKSKRPNSPIAAIGFSMGGILLGNFLMSNEQADKKYIASGVLISLPWNVTQASHNAESSWLMLQMSENLSYHLRSVIDKNKDVIFNQKNNYSLNYNRIKQSNTVRQFDTEYTIKIFNYTDVYQYYKDATLNGKLQRIKVPCLGLSAADDPFLYFKDIPTGEADERSNVAILVTSAGGHVGYLDTFWPFVINKNFMMRLVQQYLDSIMVDNNYDQFVSS
ncbi:Serine aminopeptidase, S33,Alpha/Beta hydrolase fold,AB hydrolase 4 family [Cinara cedri]|uniref:Serine aminopeptidase, S33,Alpha/Beta hydrolase fold,AB hydrolase 4 family n=1 Tax=Cinara cedri TaxID=506608 RepID=A0A5E4N823_9HEMI|nr:Serine aminopeptidase, S33,Alpha/Beta hydrolase fold,AB hydrolase 4 family [Cinara cedri]